jgi:hypothetical protein
MTALDVWCALNSSAGGPLLALVTIGGFLATGKSLLAFPKAFEGAVVSDRIRKNRFRNWAFWIGIITAVLLLVDVVAYLRAFSLVRNAEKVCIDPVSAAGAWAICLFFFCIVVTAVVGSVFAGMLAKLKETN